ncbi:cell envelope integrity protein TolA [Candidiatus Paracoxiella cheracis]|uniref:cell envelope integrity protein TolA n=1 Tax=Candidiatus Paracoxiella cheracis TaxID=3405120 RepID=UPI003BF49BB5
MFRVPPRYRVPLGISITLHVLLFLALIIELPKTNTYRMNHVAHDETKIVNAVAINTQQVDQQIKAIKQREQEKRAKETARLKQLQEQALAAQRRRIEEQRRVAKLKAEQLQLKKQRIAQAKALALKQQREKIAKQKAMQEHAKTLAAKQKQLQQQLMQQQIQQEQQQLAKVRAAQMEGILDQYKAQIIQAIQQQWIVPASASKTLSCVLLIRLAPGGVVLSVQIADGSGNAALDRSARVAVFKASPLPVPKDPAVFERFRELRLTVRPEHVTNG